MPISRRDVVIGTAGAVALGGCSRIVSQARRLESKPRATPPLVRANADERLLHRAGFGPSPEDLAHLQAIGRDAWIEEQLAAKANEDPWLEVSLRGIDVMVMDGAETRDLPENTVLQQLQRIAILRARYSRNPLRERMVDFWTNHFNIYGRKGLSAYRKHQDEEAVVRKHALGSFPEMLMASARSPAMLGFLDNRVSVRGRPNENYAREIMELHTLGVHGGYTQQDIHEVARCFTGWTVEDRFLRPRGQFRFDPDRHDDDAKVVLGHAIAAEGGIADGERVVDLLAHHPSTAKFIATKLCRYFLGDAADAWVERTAETFRKTNGDIPSTVGPILRSGDLSTSPAKIKRPFDLMISAMRATQAETNGAPPIVDALERMGEPLYQWPMPDGYPDRLDAWAHAVLPRWNFAIAIARGAINGTSIDVAALGGKPHSSARMAAIVLNRPENEVAEIVLAVDGLAPRDALAAILCAPEFQWR